MRTFPASFTAEKNCIQGNLVSLEVRKAALLLVKTLVRKRIFFANLVR